MNINKAVTYRILADQAEFDALLFAFNVVNNLIESDDEEIRKLLDYSVDRLEEHQDSIIEILDDLRDLIRR